MYAENKQAIGDYTLSDLWMGFHCGNAFSACLVKPEMRYQLIMHRPMEPNNQPDITRGTLEGQIKAGPISIFRIQSTAEAHLEPYRANGEALRVNPQSFGSIGIFALREMGRFYRHVLVEKKYPHRTAIAFLHAGKTLFAASRMLGISDLSCNLPKGALYPTEIRFKSKSRTQVQPHGCVACRIGN
jgi:L-fucose isomerase-like protein